MKVRDANSQRKEKVMGRSIQKTRPAFIFRQTLSAILIVIVSASGVQGDERSGASGNSAYPLKDSPARNSITVPTKASSYKFSSANVSIPDAGGFVSSTITISDAPSGATVTGIDVYFRCVHPYSGDLNIDLNADPQGNLGNVDLWQREGGSADNPSRTTYGVSTYNGLSANRTWYLYARDEEQLDSGYIDEWWIRVYYENNSPDLVPQSLSVSPSSVNAGSNVTASFTVRNIGTATAASSKTNIRLSTSSSNVTTFDPLLKTVTTPSLGAGSSYTHNESLTIPNGSSGTYYVWVILDVDSAIGQSDESNDKANRQIAVIAATPELVPLNLSANPSNVEAGGAMTVSITVHNEGTATASSSTTNIRLSSSSSNVTTDDPLLRTVTTPSLSAGSSYTHNESVSIPGGLSGTYYVWVIIDVYSTVGQSNESDDKVNTPISISPASPPSITSVSPDPVPGADAIQSFTVYGSDFVSGCIVRLEDITYGDTFDKSTTFVNSGQVSLSANFTTAAATWTAQVINPDGGSSSPYTFTVDAPGASNLSVMPPVEGPYRVTGVENSVCNNSPDEWTFCQHQTGFHGPGGGIAGSDDTFAWDMNLIGDLDDGAPVFAVASGTVVRYAGLHGPGERSGSVLVEHSSNGITWWSGYLHMEGVVVSLGQSVTPSTILGYISNVIDNGTSIPNHLHFVVYEGANTYGGLVSRDAEFSDAGTPDIRITPLSLTFGSPSSVDPDFFSSPEAKAGDASDQPAVVSTEIDVELGNRARFGSSRDIMTGTVGLQLADGVEEGVVESLPILAPIPFSSLGIKWTALPGDGTPEIVIRSSVNGVDWSAWADVTVDEHLTDRSSSLFFGNLIGVTEGTGLIQYAVRLAKTEGGSSPALTSLTFVFIDPGETPVRLLERLLASEPTALSRTQWGCPDGEDSPFWPYEYPPVSHLIVHHTETTNSAVDWPAQVRSIWSYHTNTRGWNDIGYNYLIDPLGVIYVGRAGGDNVKGAHFSCRNYGTQGIALLGSYTSTLPTTAAIQSLEALLAWIASREGVEPLEMSFHAATELNLDNISGHRDGNPSAHVCSSKACPGDSFYPLLPGIRVNVDALISGSAGQAFTIHNDGDTTLSITSMQLQSAGSWIEWVPSAPFDVAPGGSRQVTVSVDLDAAPAGTSIRRLLVSSNDPNESPYPDGVDIIVNTTAPPTCYSLSREHTGTGGDPSSSPTSSPGCPSGQYTAGASVQVTASPATGWLVGSWAGTIDDASTSTTNTVSMPASNHTVTANYEQIPPPCFSLTRMHTGSGADPVASPTSSPGCPSGEYEAGASVQVTASPATGWLVGSWTGTIDDASTSTTNTVSMPASNHAVTVNYTQLPPPCYSLTRAHTGSGADPVASPANSDGCPSGQYHGGESIQMTASPSMGWMVGGWTGTVNDASTAETNAVIMPASNHTVAVAYVEEPPICYTLTLSHTGSGGNPSAWPASSGGCPTGQYTVGSLIQLTASPASGWIVASWTGTDNDSSASTTNTLTMPANDHTAMVNYVHATDIFQDGFESGDTSAWSRSVGGP